MEIIPAIDIIDGKCVRLSQGDYTKKKEYNANPLEVAREYEDHGITRLHLVDLDGARLKKVINHQVLQNIAAQTKLWIDFGGGVQSDESIRIAFESGAKQVTGGSIAVKNPDLFKHWLNQYGNEKIILGADVKNEKIAISGWQEETSLSLFQFIEDYLNHQVKYTICTDVSKDGMLKGPAVDLYQKVIKKFPGVNLIASGGVSSIQDLENLAAIRPYGVIIGKAIYEGKIKLQDLKKFL